MSPIGTVVGVGFLLFFLRRTYLRQGRSVYIDTVCPWVSVQPNLRRIVQTTDFFRNLSNIVTEESTNMIQVNLAL